MPSFPRLLPQKENLSLPVGEIFREHFNPATVIGDQLIAGIVRTCDLEGRSGSGDQDFIDEWGNTLDALWEDKRLGI